MAVTDSDMALDKAVDLAVDQMVLVTNHLLVVTLEHTDTDTTVGKVHRVKLVWQAVVQVNSQEETTELMELLVVLD